VKIAAADFFMAEVWTCRGLSEGGVILLYTGRWKRKAARGPWKTSEGVAGYHADAAFFLKERGVDEFLFSAAPLQVEKGTGSPLNPIAIF
jgi:hypothetical protein